MAVWRWSGAHPSGHVRCGLPVTAPIPLAIEKATIASFEILLRLAQIGIADPPNRVCHISGHFQRISRGPAAHAMGTATPARISALRSISEKPLTVYVPSDFAGERSRYDEPEQKRPVS